MPTPEIATTILDYYYDDPSETNLHGPLVIPPFPKDTPEFTVVGWKGLPDVVAGTTAYQSAQVWGAIATTLSYIMNLKLPPYLSSWSTTYNLVAIPRAGNQLNAYYDRSSLRFFYGKDPKTNRIIYTCDAVGIVSHELGHAILDAIRPDLWDAAAMEFFSFHEAFSDIIATATVLQHDVVIEQMIAETTTPPGKIPNLWQSSVVSRLARELGHAIYFSSNMTIGAEKYLRNMFNEFNYTDPTTLPLGVTDSILSQEPHNFSRVFSGAWYECFCELFKIDYIEHNPPAAIIAVKKARDTMIQVLFEAITIAPSQLQFFQAISTTILQIFEKKGQKKEIDIIKKIFEKRNLLMQLNVVTTTTTETIYSPPQYMKATIGASVFHASQEIKVELPRMIGLLHTEQDVKTVMTKAISGYLNYVSSQSLLGDEGDNAMFIINEGKLKRNYICSSFRGLPQMSASIGHIAR
jgi:hypothetical protein